MDKIVLNIPHSSVNGIFDTYGKWPRNPHFINDCVNKWTDWYTDFLFASPKENVVSVVFPYSRFVCDVERLINDPMEAEGQGILYRSFRGYKRGELSGSERKFLYDLRESHLDELKRNLTPNSLLIDSHSFPADLYDCDICIGFNDDSTYDESMVKLVKRQFEEYGYEVSINAPFSNSISPNTGFVYKSLMIEVNKRVYMERGVILKRSSLQWMRWFGCLNALYSKILPENLGNVKCKM